MTLFVSKDMTLHTAKREDVYVLFEWPGGWSRDILDGGTFGEELSASIKAKLKGKASLQLIRRPGRKGRELAGGYRCYLVWVRAKVVEQLELHCPENLKDLDLTGPGRNHATRVAHPLVLVCTHSKRDACCAVKGRPLAAQLEAEFHEQVWEASHVGGHRFAPAVLLLPWGYSFGRLTLDQGRALVHAARKGEYFLSANRGNGLLSPRAQVAELAVAARLHSLSYGQLRAEDDGSVTHADGRSWHVELEQREVPGVVSSCGAEPKVGTVWVATAVRETGR
ncbi:sucrase ferredoxin [Corynebacterium phocae]|nr:sucrase ferredoxin [Corynebacterium phocae]